MENNFNELSFEQVDRGNFEFHNWKENPVFIGKFERFWISQEKGGSDPVTGSSMTDQNGQRFNLGESWQIKDFFDVNMIIKILAKRALDSKGMRKMQLQ